MVFVDYEIMEMPSTGLITVRDTGKYAALLCIESIFGTIVAASNILIVAVIIAGWRRLMRNNFYVIVASITMFTSLKAIVELAFILPYYIMRGNRNGQETGFFSSDYEYLIFNLSVFADYGVLFFSTFIAAHRLVAVTSNGVSNRSRSITIILCAFVAVCAALIPLIFYFCKCQFVYSEKAGVYFNKCAVLAIEPSPLLFFVIDSVVYLSGICCAITLILYVFIFAFLRRKRSQSLSYEKTFHRNSPELRLLKQSFIVFLLYAASIVLVFLLSFYPKLTAGTRFFVDISDIAYAENLLNLSIAAVYPICFLLMSGEMKSILVSKLMPTRAERVATISLNNSNNKNRNNTV